MDANLPSAKLVSQLQVKPHLQAPLGSICHLTVPAVTVPACHQLCPACSCDSVPAPLPARDTTAGKTGAAGALAHGGSQTTSPGSPECLYVGC